MNLGDKIYALRTRKGLSQGDLAEALDVSRQSISKWETNASVPELDKLLKLSEVFGVSLDDLVTGREAAQPSEPQASTKEKPAKPSVPAAWKWCMALGALVCVLLVIGLLLGRKNSDFSVAASEVRRIHIAWETGTVRITVADTNKITVAGPKDSLSTEVTNGLLKIQCGNAPGDLAVTLPKDWVCEDLTIQATSATIEATGLSVGALNLSGSQCALNFSGSVDRLKINGKSIAATARCSNRISDIVINGNLCSLDLTLPQKCGFSVALDADIRYCKFNSDLPGITFADGKYLQGDQHCKIQIDGSPCDVFVTQSPDAAPASP